MKTPTLLIVFALLTCGVGATPQDSGRTPTFLRGVSIAHWLAKVYDPAGPGAGWFKEADVRWIADQGFDHVRIALDGRWVWKPDGSLDEDRLAPLIRAMKWSRGAGLGVVVDMHFVPGGVYDKDVQDTAVFTSIAAQDEAARFWRSFAERFKQQGSFLRFELINEPMAPSGEQLNRFNEAMIAAIRSVDATRFLYVTSNLSSVFATLPEVRIPADQRVGIVLHYDEPEVFTHQKASWKQCPPDMPPIEFPGRVPDLRNLFPKDHFAYKASLTELSVASVEADFERADAWIRVHAPGREVYLGEFGVYDAAPPASRRAYVRAVSQAASRRGWGWAVWSYHGSFTVRDSKGNPTPVLEGLFDQTSSNKINRAEP
jgi:endoglucanase